jgi:hypothetical protein
MSPSITMEFALGKRVRSGHKLRFETAFKLSEQSDGGEKDTMSASRLNVERAHLPAQLPLPVFANVYCQPCARPLVIVDSQD